jgi:hypothetical protein
LDPLVVKGEAATAAKREILPPFQEQFFVNPPGVEGEAATAAK